MSKDVAAAVVISNIICVVIFQHRFLSIIFSNLVFFGCYISHQFIKASVKDRKYKKEKIISVKDTVLSGM